ncbi:Gfo/Idh/MocA family oxidoreductase [Verrucomicrobium spinosum]|uniref:Gfo/Idh/MocA family oxidoreductase n=1 Tax=Verrucomicrobium spinosum TaxID=2736 RepID=UPI00210B076E|nr:Gfo/Idh/MocA family oxidoreductase [Verrucomicrobium spinosum]
MSSDPKRIRIGIVGAGGIVKSRHLPALQAMPEVEIVAVSNATLESSQRFCAELAPTAEPCSTGQNSSPVGTLTWSGSAPRPCSTARSPATPSALASTSSARRAWP